MLPVVMSVLTVGVTVAVFVKASPGARNPALLAMPVMMLASLALTIGRRRGLAISIDRDEYLAYLRGLRDRVTEVAVTQRHSMKLAHPDPDTLWTLVGGARMWPRQSADPDFCRVRVGLGCVPLATPLVAAPTPSAQRCDPVTILALRRFVRTHSALVDVPVAITLAVADTVTVDGDATMVRGLLRAMICQLATSHAPQQLRIAGVARDRSEWDWLKWLPHNQHPVAADRAGPARMMYRSAAEAHAALAAVVSPRVVVVIDGPDGDDSALAGATVLRVGGHATSLMIRHADGKEIPATPDFLDRHDAVVFARRMAGFAGASPQRPYDWTHLVGIEPLTGFDPVTLWRNQDRRERLRVPIGATPDGRPVELDIKEAAERGTGPHGLCVGATGSGKSELLRTIALGMMARNSPAVLNLLLIDFKGGATFLDLASAPHVAAVITNLADEAPLVVRMRDALAGEMNRRQQLLRAAGNVISVAAYEQSRGAGSEPLPTLFIIVDEFSELLSQHPDFADTFVAIGRLGRSLGMHLLLASQRLEEGRLRGLDAHLSYRMCLKTLSAGESRAVLGIPDAYELPLHPGAGFLRTASGELTRFQAAYVSGTERAGGVESPSSIAVGRFTAEAVGAQTPVATAPGRSVLRTVLERLQHQAPPAHQVWLPPLDGPPLLRDLLKDCRPTPLTAPIGIVDRPFDQCRTPLTVDLSGGAGNVGVVGAPRSGKSTALGTLITALAATHDPGQVQFYCLDFGGGELSAVRDMAHVGAVADRSRPELVRRVVAEMESAVHDRQAFVRDGGTLGSFAHLFLVVDGWAGLRQEFDAAAETITALAAQGLSYRVHIVLTATRWAEFRPALKDQLGTRIELRLGDAADSEVDRRQARLVPIDRPGRGLCGDGKHMLIALPVRDGLALCRSGRAAPPIPLLPSEVDYQTVICADQHRDDIVIGLSECKLRSVALDFGADPHLLILGDNGCGKTAVLRTLCREIVRTRTPAQARLMLVDFRRTLLGVVESDHLGGYAMSPAALSAVVADVVERLRARMPAAEVSPTQLRARSWWTGPDLYIVVDDYDLVAGSAAQPLLQLLEYLPYSADLGLHVIVARRSGGAARALFEPLLAGLRELGSMGLVMSGRSEEGVLLGSRPPVPLPPGRGTLITRPGIDELIQVAWSPPA